MKISAELAGVPVGEGCPVRIMGVINVSPESFFKGSVHVRANSIKVAARRMTEDGADFIDVGAMSTAPYLKTQISEKDEAERLGWAVRIIRKHTRLPISIDTSRPLPALEGLKAGGKILNDVRGLAGDSAMPGLAKKFSGVILMAHPASIFSPFPKRDKHNPMATVTGILRRNLKLALGAGVSRSRIVIDPGIGFFRNEKWPWWAWDLEILRELKKLRALHQPILIGVSRKSFIGHFTGALPDERLAGSLAATTAAVLNGASIVRTHDVRETREAVRVAESFISV